MTTTDTETVTAELVPVTGTVVDLATYRAQIVMEPSVAKAMDEQLRAMMREVLTKDVDYGVIPGTGDKPTLLKPGAEKLLQWFGFGNRNDQVDIERDPDGRRVGVTYRCTIIKTMPDGHEVTVATCEGYAGYDEDRFYISAADAEAKERDLANRYNRAPQVWKFREYRAPWNSVIKMAQKRSLVGAAIVATGASGLFTQDLEDTEHTTVTTVDPAAVTAAVAEAANPMIKSLRPDALAALDKWFQGKGWKGPRTWDLPQWCEALIQAGRLDAAAEGPGGTAAAQVRNSTAQDGMASGQDQREGQQAAPAGPEPAGQEPATGPAEDTQPTEPATAETGQASDEDRLAAQQWLSQAASAVSTAGYGGLDDLMKRGRELSQQRLISYEQAVGLSDLIAQRRIALLPDAWQAAVEEITSADDGDRLRAEAAAQLRAKKLEQNRYSEIVKAINGKVQMVLNTARAAAATEQGTGAAA